MYSIRSNVRHIFAKCSLILSNCSAAKLFRPVIVIMKPPWCITCPAAPFRSTDLSQRLVSMTSYRARHDSTGNGRKAQSFDTPVCVQATCADQCVYHLAHLKYFSRGKRTQRTEIFLAKKKTDIRCVCHKFISHIAARL